MPKGQSLYHRFPDYRVDLDPNPRRARVRFAGEVIADSTRSLVVRETKHDPVVYFPCEDVRMQHLERTQHDSFCPFKGQAAYWSIRVGDAVSENAVWSYEDPFDEAAGLKGYVAFYPDRTQLEESDRSD